MSRFDVALLMTVIVALYGGAAAWDYTAAVATAANAGQHPDLPKALYCPRHDARNMALRHEIAHRADNGHWGISCLYVVIP